MKGLKIIPLFAVLVFLSYLGVAFVHQNPAEVVVRFGQKSTNPSALGFVILSSALAGMIFAGLLCSIELMVLYMQNKRMKRKLFPRSPAPRGAVSSMLGGRLEETLNEDVDERIRNSSEPGDDTDGGQLK